MSHRRPDPGRRSWLGRRATPVPVGPRRVTLRLPCGAIPSVVADAIADHGTSALVALSRWPIPASLNRTSTGSFQSSRNGPRRPTANRPNHTNSGPSHATEPASEIVSPTTVQEPVLAWYTANPP